MPRVRWKRPPQNADLPNKKLKKKEWNATSCILFSSYFKAGLLQIANNSSTNRIMGDIRYRVLDE